MRTSTGWLALAVTAVLGWISDCDAFYLDKGRNFDVRVRAYSQLGIMTQNSERQGCGLVKGADGRVLFEEDPRRSLLPGDEGVFQVSHLAFQGEELTEDDDALRE